MASKQLRRILTADEVFSRPGKRGLVKYSRQHGARLEAEDKFPRRRRLGDGRVGWFEDEIADWMESLPQGPATFKGRRAGAGEQQAKAPADTTEANRLRRRLAATSR